MSSSVVLIVAIVVCVVAYIAAVALMPKKNNEHLKVAMERLKEQKEHLHTSQSMADNSRRSIVENNIFVRAYLALPYFGNRLNMIERAGLLEHFDHVIMIGIALLLALLVLLASYGALGMLAAPIITFFIMYMFVRMRANKRRKHFLDLFPDALDIIVRSVKAGYPINSAIGMVADSMPSEIGYEYLRIMNEASFGYSLTQAVQRFAERFNEPDISFFSVVISVQQETGGNLSEVLGNLSTVIRQRKHIRLKIRALSAEGFMTVWILVGIAFFMVGAVFVMSPGHFGPLLHTSSGHTVMISVGSAFVLAYFTIRKIVNFRI